jgi:hypothetical protein
VIMEAASKNLWNVGKFLPDYKLQHSRRQSAVDYQTVWNCNCVWFIRAP